MNMHEMQTSAIWERNR